MAFGSPEQIEGLRAWTDPMLEGLRLERVSWWMHWTELAEFFLPRRYLWLVTPNRAGRGSPINQAILNNTPILSARTCASGILAGTSSPARPWFRLTIPGFDIEENSAIKAWLDEVESRVMRVFAESNYYQAKATQILDMTIFGTAPMIIYEDYDDVIRCYNPCAGEYFVGLSNRLAPNRLYREYTYTVAQTVQEFGLENCSDGLQGLYTSKDSSSQNKEVIICHGIEPNDRDHGDGLVPKEFPFRETYWEKGVSRELVLRVRGFYEQPFSAPRWDVVGNDAYGRSPAMDALGDVKQLNQMIKRQAQGIDKLVNPPLKASVQMKNRPASSLPGALTYVDDMGPGNGMAPVYEVNPRLLELRDTIEGVKQDIRNTFFNDLFQMISQLDTVRTATEIDARREEKLVLLGPVLERLQGEGAGRDIDRTLRIMERARLLPPAPEEIQGAHIEPTYISMLAMAQRAASTAAIERVAQFVGNIVAVDPTAIDNIDVDEMIDAYGDALDVPAKILRPAMQVAQLRAQRAQQQQQAQLGQVGMGAVQAGKVLSETDVGGGVNALQAMLGNQPVAGSA
jgi:hypothetical protein